MRAVLTMTVDPGRTARLLTSVHAVGDHARGCPGCVDQRVDLRPHAGPDARDEVVVVTEWVDRASFHAFETSDEQDRLVAPIAALRHTVRMDLTDIDPTEGDTP